MQFRFWLEVALATITGILFVVTFFWNDWIELVFHVDPDSGGGSLERLLVGVLLVLTIVCVVLARFEWRRIRLVTAK